MARSTFRCWCPKTWWATSSGSLRRPVLITAMPPTRRRKGSSHVETEIREAVRGQRGSGRGEIAAHQPAEAQPRRTAYSWQEGGQGSCGPDLLPEADSKGCEEDAAVGDREC